MKTISEAKAKKIKKIQKMIDKYNRKASKWGYPTIVLQDNGWPSPFGYSEIKDGNSFWDVIKNAYRDGYLSSDYNKILKYSRCVRNCI